jgi:hypothetical protein
MEAQKTPDSQSNPEQKRTMLAASQFLISKCTAEP